jgi:hypothetical protein
LWMQRRHKPWIENFGFQFLILVFWTFDLQLICININLLSYFV